MSDSMNDAIITAWHVAMRPGNIMEPDAFLTSLAAAGYVVERDWCHDMAKAPRDGTTRFWGLVGDDAIAMLWHPGFGAFVKSWRRMTLANGMTFADTGLAYQDHSPEVCEPTAWRLLPAPPAAKEGKE
jgi:hypothetical protein